MGIGTLPWIFHCEAMKKGKGLEERYQVQVAILLDSHLKLDEKLNELFKQAGLLFLYSDVGKPIIQHLEQADFYDQPAIDLAQKVSKEQPISFQITKLLSSNKAENQPTNYLDIKELQTFDLPNQDHLPFWDHDWITEELKELLFLQPQTIQKTAQKRDILRTYLILDAHIYTANNGVFDLDLVENLTVQCLYKGKAAEQLKYVAPYLIEMTLPENGYDDKDKVPDFHKSYFEKQWGNDASMFIRTTASMTTVHNHFRKFNKIQNDQGKSFLFRFYDQKILSPYLSVIKNWPERLVRLYTIETENQIHSITCSDGKNSAITFSPNPALLEFDYSTKNIRSPQQTDYDICLEIGFANQAKKLLIRLYKNLEKSHGLVPAPEHQKIATHTIKRMAAHGLKTPLFLETLIAWSLLLHPEFEQQDPENIMEQILGTSQISQHEKFQALSAQMQMVYGETI